MKNPKNTIKLNLKQKVFLQSFILNILCILLFKLICEVHFDTNTDQFINHILSGVHGENASPYGWFHIITGYILKTLYSIIPKVPWYALTQYFCIFISLLLLSYIIFKMSSGWGSYAANILVFILIGYECYARISYVKTGVLCLVVSCFIFYQLICERINGKIYFVSGILLFLTGYLWWNKAIFLGIIMFFPCIYHLYKRKDLNSFKDYKLYILIGFILILCPVLLEVGNELYLKRNSEIAKNVEYAKTLEYITNYGWPDFYEYYSLYEELGISENTYYLLSNNEFVNQYVIEYDTLIKIQDFVDRPGFTISDFLDFTRTYPIRYFETGLFIGFLICLIPFFLSKADEKTKKLMYLFCGTGGCYYICYLAGIDDIAVIRTVIWMTAIIFVLALSHNISIEELELKPYYSAVITIAMVILINQKLNDITQVISYDYITKTTEWINLVTSDPSKTYVTNSTDFYQKDMPFAILEKASLDNFLIAQFPYALHNSKEFSAVLDNPNEVYFISESCAVRTANFINEHYDANYYPVQMKNINDISFYMIRGGNPDIDKGSIKAADFDIVSDLYLYTLEAGNKAVEGSIYKKDTNSFSQICYIEVYNTFEDSYTFYDVLQSRSSFSSDVMNGEYSKIYAEIETSGDQEYNEYAVILEVDGNMYRVPLFEEDIEETLDENIVEE